MCLSNQVCDVLKPIAARYDDYRKRHESLSVKLLAERDSVYSDLKKSKAAYDAACREVEDKRARVDRSFEAGRAKAEKSYQAQLTEMNNVKVCLRYPVIDIACAPFWADFHTWNKNMYLLQIAITNRQKQKYFHEDLPELLDV